MLFLASAIGAAPSPAPREIDVRVASDAAAPEGIIVRVTVPPKGRYGAQAPVVIQVPGGWGGGELARPLGPFAAMGFVELRFCFPGGGRPPLQSGGQDDVRGPGSVLALADVIAFANGATKSMDGRSLADLAAPVEPLSDEVGLLGWSNGGNAAVVALAEHQRKVEHTAWVATWETPVGDGAPTVLLGPRGRGVIPVYDPDTGRLDLSELAWDPELLLPVFAGRPEVAGALYFDLNHNGRWTEKEPVPQALRVPGPGGRPAYAYPLCLVREAQARRLIPGRWPAYLLDPAATESCWRERNAEGHFLRAAVNCRKLLAIVIGTAADHVQAAPDHPHIDAAYQGWLEADLAWVRLNPDASYVAALVGQERANGYIETVANVPLGRRGLATQLVPAGLVPPPLLGVAAACELADRSHTGNVALDLEQPLFAMEPDGGG